MEFSKKDTLMVKGIAIVLMYFHHNFFRLNRFEEYIIISTPFSDETIRGIAQFSKVCVALFVFLSAYGMTLKYKSFSNKYEFSLKNVYDVSIKRLVSLMFGYWFIFFLVHFVAILFDRARLLKIYGEGIDGFVRWAFDLLGIAELLKIDSFVGTWWYIGFAIVLILIMPLLLQVYRGIGVLIVPLAFLLPRYCGWMQIRS